MRPLAPQRRASVGTHRDRAPMHHSAALQLQSERDADGLTLVLKGTMNAPFHKLRAVFQGLADRPMTVDVHALDFVGGDGTRLRLVSTRDGQSAGLRRGLLQKAGVSREFEWLDSQEMWLESAEKIASLIDSESPCHQYLESSSTDDALVVISRGE
jgi:hypothetical protein